MAQKKSKLAKFFIYLVLFFIIFSFGAIYIVMYAGINESNGDGCPEGYVLNEETGECEEEIVELDEENIENTVLDNEGSCTEAGGTWYEENQICILPEA